ncbi:hypothetical protein B296_00049122 [Ensete ventricosum]|uniref:BHLH domain-containing protein n=1 Tax=Ensete ventricosum TaxID=4639 RepID=A0A426YS32_ENSVE|nr:hypothetical protein B296_00049122 [Ensete ventricosum]
MKGAGDAAAKMERKTVEKNRRMHMKRLCMKLASLIPKEYAANSKDMLSQQDHLDQATSYIKDLRGRIERMKQQRGDIRTSAEGTNKDVDSEMKTEFRLPVVEVRHRDQNLEVVLVSGLQKRFKFHEVIGVLEEEGAEVVNANFSVVGEMIFLTIHSQVITVSVLYSINSISKREELSNLQLLLCSLMQAVSSRLGLEASRVSERLKELIR